LLFGLQIPFPPDFLLDHTLLGKESSERIREHSRRWTQFVSGLWRSTEDVTYALRFDLNQNHKSIDTYILGRLQTQKSLESINQAQILLTDLQRMLESFRFEPQLMTRVQLQSLLDNSTHRYCFEVCQEEVATPIRQDVSIAKERGRSDKDTEFSIPKEFVYQCKIYGIRPWWGLGGTFLVPFSTIASQNNSVSVCILLAPTTLKLKEQELLADIARQAESLAQRQTKGGNFTNPQVNPSQNKTDPQLRWESRLYAANLRRLNYPFLTTRLCFSDDKSAAQQVASAFSSTIREERSYENPVGESEN